MGLPISSILGGVQSVHNGGGYGGDRSAFSSPGLLRAGSGPRTNIFPGPPVASATTTVHGTRLLLLPWPVEPSQSIAWLRRACGILGRGATPRPPAAPLPLPFGVEKHWGYPPPTVLGAISRGPGSQGG